MFLGDWESKTENVIVNITVNDWFKLTIIPVIIFSTILIIDWIFFRKNKEHLKKTFYINIILLSIIFVVNGVVNLLNIEEIFISIEERMRDWMPTIQTYLLTRNFYVQFFISMFVVNIGNCIKVNILKKQGIEIKKAYKRILICCIIILVMTFISVLQYFNILKFVDLFVFPIKKILIN